MNRSYSRLTKWIFAIPIVLAIWTGLKIEKDLPPLVSPDEDRHFFYGMNQDWGRKSPGEKLSCDPVTQFNQTIFKDFDPEFAIKKRELRFKGWEHLAKTLQYDPVVCREGYINFSGYIEPFSYPQVSAAKVFGGQSLTNDSIVNLLEFYRFCRWMGFLLMWLLPVFLWIRIALNTSVFNVVNYFLSLVYLSIPIIVQQSLSVTADILSMMATLAIGLILTSSSSYVGLGSWFLRVEKGFCLIILFMASYTKPVFIGLILSLIAAQRIQKKGSKWQTGFLLLIILASLLKGVLFVKNSLPHVPLPEADPIAQKVFVLSHPITTFTIVMNSSLEVMRSVYDIYLGWLVVPPSELLNWISKIPIFIFFSVFFIPGILKDIPLSKFKISKGAVLWSACSFLGLVGFIFLNSLAMYLAHTAPGATEVNGLQARYFLPVWVFVGFWFVENLKECFQENMNLRIFTFLSIFSLVLASAYTGIGLAVADLFKQNLWLN